MVTSLVIVHYCCHRSGCISALMYGFLNKAADICHSGQLESSGVVPSGFTQKMAEARAACWALLLPWNVLQRFNLLIVYTRCLRHCIVRFAKQCPNVTQGNGCNFYSCCSIVAGTDHVAEGTVCFQI